MDLVSIVHTAVLVVAFLSGAYVVFVTAQKADGLFKPVGMLLGLLLAAAAVLFIVGHAMGKMGGHEGGTPAAKPPAAATDTAKAGGGK